MRSGTSISRRWRTTAYPNICRSSRNISTAIRNPLQSLKQQDPRMPRPEIKQERNRINMTSQTLREARKYEEASER